MYTEHGLFELKEQTAQVLFFFLSILTVWEPAASSMSVRIGENVDFGS